MLMLFISNILRAHFTPNTQLSFQSGPNSTHCCKGSSESSQMIINQKEVAKESFSTILS